MKSTILELWYGNIGPCESCGGDDAEIARLVMLMGENEDILKKQLGQQHAVLFQEYAAWADKYACYLSACAFRDGFRLAAKIYAEILATE